MTYDPMIPNANETPKASPSQIKTNFSVFGTAEAINHVAMNTIGYGKHAVVLFKQQSSDPTVNSSFGAVYCKTAVQASGNALNLFFRTMPFLPPAYNNAPQQITFNVIQYTGVAVTLIGPPPSVYTNMQQTFMFGGFLIYTGFVQPNIGVAPFTLDVAVAGSGIVKPSKILYAKVMGDSASFSVAPANSGSTITVGISGVSTYNYFAIGLV